MRRISRFAAVGILLSSLGSPALSQTLADRPVPDGETGSFLLASLGIPKGPLDFQRLNRFFDRSAARAVSAAPLPKAPAAAPRRRRIKTEQPHRKLRIHRYPLVVPPPRATRAWRRTFRILRSNPKKTDRYDDIVLREARRHGLDPRLLKAIIAAESEFRPHVKSPAGAIGLMQVMPRTAEWMGVHRSLLTDPQHNIKAGAAYLAHLFRRAWREYKLKGLSFRDAPLWIVQRIIAAYNAGPRFLYRNRWYRETRRYVRKVLLFYRDKVTDIRRIPPPAKNLPRFKLIRSSSGFFN